MSTLRVSRYNVSLTQYDLSSGGGAVLSFESEYGNNFHLSITPEDLMALASWLQLETKLRIKTHEELSTK